MGTQSGEDHLHAGPHKVRSAQQNAKSGKVLYPPDGTCEAQGAPCKMGDERWYDEGRAWTVEGVSAHAMHVGRALTSVCPDAPPPFNEPSAKGNSFLRASRI